MMCFQVAHLNTYTTHLRPISSKLKKSEKTTNSRVEKKETKKHSTNGTKKTKMSFEEQLLCAIDAGLSVLGESSKHSVYYYLEKKFKISRLEIPYKLEEFIDAIERIFGFGAKMLEIQIMKCLFNIMGHSVKNYPKKKSLTFIEYVETVKISEKET